MAQEKLLNDSTASVIKLLAETTSDVCVKIPAVNFTTLFLQAKEFSSAGKITEALNIFTRLSNEVPEGNPLKDAASASATGINLVNTLTDKAVNYSGPFAFAAMLTVIPHLITKINEHMKLLTPSQTYWLGVSVKSAFVAYYTLSDSWLPLAWVVGTSVASNLREFPDNFSKYPRAIIDVMSTRIAFDRSLQVTSKSVLTVIGGFYGAFFGFKCNNAIDSVLPEPDTSDALTK